MHDALLVSASAGRRTWLSRLLLIAVLVAIAVPPYAGAGLLTNSGGSLAAADASFIGQGGGDETGTSVARAGDVNGDGFDDLVVGAPRNDAAGTDAGAAFLVLGGPGGWGAATPLGGPGIIRYTGEAPGDLAGVSVSGAGDVNGDGFDDVVLGATNIAALQAGAAYLVAGSPAPVSGPLSTHVRYTGEAVGDNAGFSVSGAGDVDGDGLDDLVVGAVGNDAAGTNAGAAYLVSGSPAPSSGSLSAHVRYTGEAAADQAGRSVSGAGDVDGDGLDDLLVGAPFNAAAGANAGAAYLVSGSPAPSSGSLSAHVRYTGEAAADQAGRSVSGAGDVDGDGLDDLLVGAPFNAAAGANAGAAYLVSGSPAPASASLSAHVRYTGEAAGDLAGVRGSGGDINGDGLDDLIVGANGNDAAGTNAGAAYLVSGSPAPASASLSAHVRYTGEAAGDNAGFGVSDAGDVNGDGLADLVVGAFGNDGAGTDAGAAYLLFATPDPDNPAYRHRNRLRGNAGDSLPARFEQARAVVDFTSGALAEGSVDATRYIFDPCQTTKRAARAIWELDSNKVDKVTGSSLRLTFSYTNAEIRGIKKEDKVNVWTRPPGDPCGKWTKLKKEVTRDPTTNRVFVTLTGVKELGWFAVSNGSPT